MISNSSDALDKLKFLSITDKKFQKIDFQPRIDISFSEDDCTLTISDNGIGMNKSDLKDNLGTIARSGTNKFIEAIKSKKESDLSAIGQFGVGFYSSYMVAENVDVLSKHAEEKDTFKLPTSLD